MNTELIRIARSYDAMASMAGSGRSTLIGLRYRDVVGLYPAMVVLECYSRIRTLGCATGALHVAGEIGWEKPVTTLIKVRTTDIYDHLTNLHSGARVVIVPLAELREKWHEDKQRREAYMPEVYVRTDFAPDRDGNERWEQAKFPNQGAWDAIINNKEG